MKKDLYELFKKRLEDENIHTWFDMGLLLDRIRDGRQPIPDFPATFQQFKLSLQSGIAFITFEYGVDGVTIEVKKYAQIFNSIIQKATQKPAKIYWIGSELNVKNADLGENCQFLFLKGADGFDKWDGYTDYFFTKLSRGSEIYNELAKKIWTQTVNLSLQLGKFIVEHDINLLIPVNANSNPGNVSLAFAIVLVSEIMGVPVLNSNHDFYWEDGAPPGKTRNPGQRDHFFTNHHLGEVFSLIEMLYPWDSPRWFQAVINPLQRYKLINRFGFNPIATKVITTFVDTAKFKPISQEKKKEIFKKLQLFFARDRKKLFSTSVYEYLSQIDSPAAVRTPVILSASNRKQIQFNGQNMLVLQPTRILRRKQIERNFDLIRTLFHDRQFQIFLDQNKNMDFILMITGPVSPGNRPYFKELIINFKVLLDDLAPLYRKRIFLALKFGKDSNEYMEKMQIPSIKIEELYVSANMVVLPSKSEGRGLPIIESCACGVPIIVNRYKPEAVFSAVIGEHLDKSLRLKVFEFPKKSATLPENFIKLYNNPEYMSRLILQNRKNVKKRFSFFALEKHFNRCLYVLWRRCQSPSESHFERIKQVFKYHQKTTKYDRLFHQVVLAEHRKYIPGISPIEFMVVLKSLIDPSYFRIEEKELRGRVMHYARHLVKTYEKYKKLKSKTKIEFFNNVDAIFDYYEGTDEIVMDHSLSYRHRHNKHYPYRKITEFELFGLIALLFRGYVKKSEILPLHKRLTNTSQTIRSSLMRLVGYRKLAINDSHQLLQALESNKPFAWFPSDKWLFELRIFVIETLRHRLKIPPGVKVTDELLASLDTENIGRVYLLVRKKSIGTPIYYRNVLLWLKNLASTEIKAFYNAGLFQIVKTNVISSGAHLGQLGINAKKTLLKIKKRGGFVVSVGETNYLAMDLIDLPSFRIGVARYPLLVHYLGVRRNEAFIQWVPPGLAPCLAYPTPLQTAKEFSSTLKGKLFFCCVKEYGREKTIRLLRDEASKSYLPLKQMLKKILRTVPSGEKGTEDDFLTARMFSGLHTDGLPWSGVTARLKLFGKDSNQAQFNFHTVFSPRTGKTVMTLTREFEKSHKEKVVVAMNGGYMLNPELVGKLGLPEKYIGSPLGLVIKNQKILSLPLYNKPAFVIKTDFTISIQRANLKDGLKISVPGGDSLELSGEDRNNENSEKPVYFDLMYSKSEINAKGRIIYRFAGNRIIAKIGNQVEKVNLLPVGLTVSVPEDMQLKGWEVDAEVEYHIPGWDDVLQAVEAGPSLVREGKIAIEMVEEGWKTKNSIATQAARVDYEHLRGPKIGAGLTPNNELVIVAINGRIRESVGATHRELAKILVDEGCVQAMGFDPGGSVTLIVHGKQLNVTPYNQNYDDNPYSLPPQPRRIGSAILITDSKID